MSETGRRESIQALGVVAAGNFVQLGSRFLVGALVPLVLTEFETGKSAVGLALTGMWAIYALGQFPSGVLADRFGERRLLIAGLVGTVVGMALIAVAPSLPLFALAVLTLGAGTGLYFAPGSSLLTRLFEDAGGPLGWLTAAGAVAGVVYPTLGNAVGVRYGWEVAAGLASVVAVPVLLGTLVATPTPEPANSARRLGAAVDLDRIRATLARPAVAYTTLLAVLVSFTFQGFTSFFTTFLVEYRGLDPGTAGIFFGGVFGISSLAQPVGGWLSDRTSRDLALGISITIAASGLIVLLSVGGWQGVLAGSAVFGVGLSWPGTIQARIMDRFEDAERGYGFGLVRTVYMLLGASGSVVVGTAASVGGWQLGYAVPVAVLATALLALGINRALGLGL
ncbi:MAG: MFS transporter [Halobacteriales archaeon]